MGTKVNPNDPISVPAAQYRPDDVEVLPDGIYMEDKPIAIRLARATDAEWSAVKQAVGHDIHKRRK